MPLSTVPYMDPINAKYEEQNARQEHHQLLGQIDPNGFPPPSTM